MRLSIFAIAIITSLSTNAVADDDVTIDDIIGRWVAVTASQGEFQATIVCTQIDSVSISPTKCTTLMRGRDADCMRLDLLDGADRPTHMLVWTRNKFHVYLNAARTVSTHPRVRRPLVDETELTLGRWFQLMREGNLLATLPTRFLYPHTLDCRHITELNWQWVMADGWYYYLETNHGLRGRPPLRVVLNRQDMSVRQIVSPQPNGDCTVLDIELWQTNPESRLTEAMLLDELPRDWQRVNVAPPIDTFGPGR